MVKDGIYYACGLLAAGFLVGWLAGWAWASPFVALAAFCLYFFRDPDRAVPEGPVAVSPADGKVVHIRELEDGRRRISVFLNIFDVHVNRAPVSGRITDQIYQRGRFVMAHHETASVENEQNALTIDSDGTPVVVRQIAGLVARRIVCHKKVGDRVERGERFGLIKFGSRTDVILGPEWRIEVVVGQRVWAGSSVLARRREKAE